MPGKEKESHRTAKPGSLKHESQRVRTEKVVEEKHGKKSSEESSRKSRSSAAEEKALRRSEMAIPDSKKVSFPEESRVEVKKSKKPDDSGRKGRSDEMPLPDFDDNYTPKKSSKHAVAAAPPPPAKKPVTPEEAADNYEYDDDFEEYQDDFEDENEFEREESKPSPAPVQTKKLSPQPEQLSNRTSTDSYDSDKRDKKQKSNDMLYDDDSGKRERKQKSSEMSYDFDDDGGGKKEKKSKKSNELTIPDSYENENKRERKQKFTEPSQPSYSKPQPSIGLNFKAAIQRTSKLSRRANDILRLVTFDVTRIDFFDFPVVSEYDLYILNYGKANRKQTATQTNDDAVSRDTQTEKFDLTTKWTQNPPNEDDEHCGFDTMDQDQKEVSRKKGGPPEKAEQFVEFMKDASSAMMRVLDDLVNRQNNGQIRKSVGGRKRMETKFGATFGSKVASVSQANIFTDDHYALERICFPPHSSAYLITLHGPKEGEVTFGQPHKIIVWNTVAMQSGLKPEPKVIVSSGVRVTCVSMESGLSPELLFAGHVDGSLAVWDFRATFNNNAASFRSSGVVATSSAVFTSNDTHLAPLKCMLPLPLSAGSSLTESQAGLRCELLSLDESGLLATWAVADLGVASNRTMNDDPAVTPGGRIRLLRSSFGRISSSLSPTDGLLEPTCILSHPTGPSRVLIGMSSGDTLHVARYGGRGGGLGSAHPNVFTRKFVSPVINLAHFISDGTENTLTASSEIVGAFIAATAIGFSIYVTSRSQPVLTFEVESGSLQHVFPIPTTCALTVLGSSNSQGTLATVAALTTESKIELYQIGPKFCNQWSGASTEIPTPTPGGAAARSAGGGGTAVQSLQMCVDTAGFDIDDDATTTSRRYLSAVAFSSGTVDLFLSELVLPSDNAASSISGSVSSSLVVTPPEKMSRQSPNSQVPASDSSSLIDYLTNLV